MTPSLSPEGKALDALREARGQYPGLHTGAFAGDDCKCPFCFLGRAIDAFLNAPQPPPSEPSVEIAEALRLLRGTFRPHCSELTTEAQKWTASSLGAAIDNLEKILRSLPRQGGEHPETLEYEGKTYRRAEGRVPTIPWGVGDLLRLPCGEINNFAGNSVAAWFSGALWAGAALYREIPPEPLAFEFETTVSEGGNGCDDAWPIFDPKAGGKRFRVRAEEIL